MAALVGNFAANIDGATMDGGGTALQRMMSHTGPTNTDGDNDEEEVFTPIEERHEQITKLARQITRQSTRPGGLHRVATNGSVLAEGDIFDYEEGSDLDPFSENFDVRKWTKLVVRHRDTAPRTSGLAYSNMDVFGYGSDAGE